mmetsp:Transcript_4935/g.12334  ORF Transcript_4935/g.12334 Transcript_4935/m.12334 type:complete len:1082 (-) Transcript_4935:637-3882(-)|eukprot:CAMPEP_0179002492 /NCGR_PEP_ID=MMETSP0795-20121207/12051_1 /TAXON_ID=88552 /ORGANISM="Amoebophrya sp., Strain Ameob2" /LENGTH=1081 /DNA_ID=CAMNT_0020696193 /DNA_START=311 /DNA_END=3559 /DNA_ORIENTATION=-
MKFGKQLEWLHYAHWSPFYLDYKRLKKSLSHEAEAHQAQFGVSWDVLLHREIQKVTRFLDVLLQLLVMRATELGETVTLWMAERESADNSCAGGGKGIMKFSVSSGMLSRRLLLLKAAYENLLRQFFLTAEFAALNRKALYKIRKKREKFLVGAGADAEDLDHVAPAEKKNHVQPSVEEQRLGSLDFENSSRWQEVRAKLEDTRVLLAAAAPPPPSMAASAGSGSSKISPPDEEVSPKYSFSPGNKRPGVSSSFPKTAMSPQETAKANDDGDSPDEHDEHEDEHDVIHRNSAMKIASGNGAMLRPRRSSLRSPTSKEVMSTTASAGLDSRDIIAASFFCVTNPLERHEWDNLFVNSYWSRRWLSKNTSFSAQVKHFSLPLDSKTSQARHYAEVGNGAGNGSGLFCWRSSSGRAGSTWPEAGANADEASDDAPAKTGEDHRQARGWSVRRFFLRSILRQRGGPPMKASESRSRRNSITAIACLGTGGPGLSSTASLGEALGGSSSKGSFDAKRSDPRPDKSGSRSRATNLLSTRSFHRYEGALVILALHILFALLGQTSQPHYTPTAFFRIFPVFRLFFFAVLVFWSVALVVHQFETFGVSYVFLCDLDLKKRIASPSLYQVAGVVSFVWTLLFAFFLIDFKFALAFGENGCCDADWQTLSFVYATLVTGFFALAVPFFTGGFAEAGGYWLAELLKTGVGCFLAPIRKPTFAQLIFADCMCSLTAMWVDLAFAVCFFSEIGSRSRSGEEVDDGGGQRQDDGGVFTEHLEPAVRHCDAVVAQSEYMLVLLVYPFAVRFFQCARRFWDSGFASRRDGLNSCKYMSAITAATVIRFSSLPGIKVVAYVASALITFTWDFYMDFGFELDRKNWPRKKLDPVLGVVEAAGLLVGSRNDDDHNIQGDEQAAAAAKGGRDDPARTADAPAPSTQSQSYQYVLRDASSLLPPEKFWAYFCISLVGRATWPAATLIGTEQLRQIFGGSAAIAQLVKLVVGSLEIGRRAAWMVLRVEYEHVRNAKMHPNLCWLPLKIELEPLATPTSSPPETSSSCSSEALHIRDEAEQHGAAGGRNKGRSAKPAPAAERPW